MSKRSTEDEVEILGLLLEGHTPYHITTSKAVDNSTNYDKRTVWRVEREYAEWLNRFTITEERLFSEWVDLFQTLIASLGDQAVTLSIPVPPDSPIGQDVQKMLYIGETARRFKVLARKFREAREADPELDAEIADLLWEKSGQGEEP